MSETNVVIFGYNFPHKKTQDLVFSLLGQGFKISALIAADAVKLNISESTVRTKIKHIGLLNPAEYAGHLGIEFVNLPHNSRRCEQYLRELKPALGIIGGARIIKQPIIERFSVGIVNVHPALLPEVRGLDSMLWSIMHDIPLGVTAHLIDARIDLGQGLIRKLLPVYQDDTIFDLSERIYDSQIDIAAASLFKALNGDTWSIENEIYYGKMTPEYEQQALARLNEYKAHQHREKEMYVG
ncbi:formyltransferase family protein [Deinococcus aerophilus]|nr:formyltransferase family protein [Deinococcus aerophilus]